MAKKLDEKQMRAKLAKMITDEDLEFELEDGNVVFITDFWQDMEDSEKFVLGEPTAEPDDETEADSEDEDEDEDQDEDEA